MENKLPYLLFDIGGTNTRIAVSLDGAIISESRVFPTPDDFGQGISQIFDISKKLLAGRTAGLIAGGVAGPLDAQKTMVINPPNLPGWKNKPLGRELSKAFATEVYLENDVAMAGLGEANRGEGRDKSIVAYLTVSTGINGVRIVDGEIDKNIFGFEIGHQIIDFDNSANLGSSGKGELEDFISGREVQKRYGIPASEVVDESVWSDIAGYLAVGLNNTIVYWSPEIIVLGGSMMKKIKLEEVRKGLAGYLTIFPEIPEIKVSKLGDSAGLWGALFYLKTLQR